VGRAQGKQNIVHAWLCGSSTAYTVRTADRSALLFQYGPQISSFYTSFNGIGANASFQMARATLSRQTQDRHQLTPFGLDWIAGMFEALEMTEGEMDALNPRKLMEQRGLSAAQINKELVLLSNALAFHNKTGHIDVAYDGFFFGSLPHHQLRLLSQTLLPQRSRSTRTSLS
jgi:hypothetical protein